MSSGLVSTVANKPHRIQGVCLRRFSAYARIGVDEHLTLETDTMAHNPVNHPLRPLYRAVGFLAGAYLVVFGIVGLIQTSGEEFTGANDKTVLGQGTSPLLSIIMLAAGVIVLLATAIGRNVDTAVDKYFGWGLLVLGTFGLAFSRTDANVFGQDIHTVVVTYLV